MRGAGTYLEVFSSALSAEVVSHVVVENLDGRVATDTHAGAERTGITSAEKQSDILTEKVTGKQRELES